MKFLGQRQLLLASATLGTVVLMGAATAVPALAASKVSLCHIPPGNPSAAHTISVSENAVPAHLAHGDQLGPCYP